MSQQPDKKRNQAATLSRHCSPAMDRFVRDDSGVTSIEYALLAMLIAMVVLSSIVFLGGSVKELWATISTAVVDAL